MTHDGAPAPHRPLPAKPPRTRPQGLDWLVLALAFAFQAAFYPWFPALRSPNELTRVYLTSALLEDHTVRIDNQLRKHGRIFDVSVRKVDRKPQYYSDKAPGVALLSLPAVGLYGALAGEPASLDTKVRITRFTVSTLPTLFLLVMLLNFLNSELRDRRLSRMLVLAYALGSVATPYASLAFGHQLSAVVLFSLFLAIRALDPAAAPARSLLVGALASFALQVEYQNALLLLPFAILFAWRVRFRPAALVSALLGAVPLTLLLLAYHEAAFGSPFKTGYSFLASSFKEVHAQGLLGVSLPRASHAYLSFLSPAKGLFFFAPWLALAVPGLWSLWRSARAELRFMAAFAVLYALFVSSLVYPVGGWTVSQRHLVPAVPFLVLPVGLFLQELGRGQLLGRAVFAGLGGPSILACALSAVVWPHYQEGLQNPFWQVGLPLFRAGYAAPSVLTRLGISSVTLATVLLGASLALLASDLVRSATQLRTRVLLSAVALGVALGFVALARMPGRNQDVSGDRAFIEKVYPSLR